jgi:MoxR-like ATPase
MAVRAKIVGIDRPETLEAALRSAQYLADEGLATSAYLALALGKPLLLEGAPGVGKTEAAKAISAVLGRQLIRLQCFEGMDSAAALYEWNYPRQMLAIRQAGDEYVNIYRDDFLIARPMLEALQNPDSTVLLIDEIDRADHEFEAFLLEFLSDFQISIPERGTIRAHHPPVVILTSNRTRELHEALRRRCVYHWIEYPEAARESEIVMMRASSVARDTADAVVAAVGRLRQEPLAKRPGVAETVEWAEAATLLHAQGSPWPTAFKRAIGVALKDQDDLNFVAPRLDRDHQRRGGMTLPAPSSPSSSSPRCCAATALPPAPTRRSPSSSRSASWARATWPTSTAPPPPPSPRPTSAGRSSTRSSASCSTATASPRPKTPSTRKTTSASRRTAAAPWSPPNRTRRTSPASRRHRRASHRPRLPGRRRGRSPAPLPPPGAGRPAAPPVLSPQRLQARRCLEHPPRDARGGQARRRNAELAQAAPQALPAPHPAAHRRLGLDEGPERRKPCASPTPWPG